jgi:hypothetical protein
MLKNRVARLVLEVGIYSEDLMSRFQTVAPSENLGRASKLAAWSTS